MSKRQWIILAVLFFAVLLANYRNLRLAEKISAAREATGLSVGNALEGMALTLHDGAEYQEDFRSSAGQLVFVFSPSCPFCEKTLPLWSELAERVAADTSVLAINVSSGEDDEQYRRALPGATVGKADPVQAGANLMIATPQTLLVSPAGEVTHVWRGALTRNRADTILKALRGR